MPAKDTATGQATGDDGAAGTHDHDDGAGIQVPGTSAPSVSDPAMPPARPDPEAEARKEAGVGIGLADDLRAIRTTLVKAHLADDFSAAFDLALFQMGRAVFTPGYHDDALDIAVRETPDRPPLRANDDTFHESSPGEAMLEDRSSLRFDWLEIEDRAESFAALRALSPGDKKRLFAACVARTLNGQLAFEANARPETEATVARLGIDFAEHVRPGAEVFWSRVRKDRMLAVAKDTLGLEWAHTHRKDKKATLATAMETAFAAGNAVPPGRLEGGPRGCAGLGTARLRRLRQGLHRRRRRGRHSAGRGQGRSARRDGDGTRDRCGRGRLRAGDFTRGRGGDRRNPARGPAARGHGTCGRSPVLTPGSRPRRHSPSRPPISAMRNSLRRQNRPTAAAVPETTGSPGVPDAATVAPTGHDAIDAMNAVPTAGGGPRVIVNTVGIGRRRDGDADASPNLDPSAPPVPGNGHDAGGDALDIPAFLRRS